MCQSKANGGKRCYKAPSYKSLFSKKALKDALDNNLVRMAEHDDLPLATLKYTELATYSGQWNDVTLACRGLVIDTETDEILARPYSKFFNYGQPGCPTLDLDEEGVTVMDKLDGSAGIYVDKYNLLSTPGSANSDQAKMGTQMLREADDFNPVKGRTYMFEIIYPEGRIVLDYGDKRALVLHGAVDTKTGEVIDVDDIPEWGGEKVQKFPANTLREALSLPPRKNAEGLVIRMKDGTMVKVKQEDYIALHRVVTGLSPRVIWRLKYMKSLQDSGYDKERLTKQGFKSDLVNKYYDVPTESLMDEFREALPDEWHEWTENTAAELDAQLDAEMQRIHDLRANLPEFDNKKDRALYIQANYPKKDQGFLHPPELNEPKTRATVFDKLKPEADPDVDGDE